MKGPMGPHGRGGNEKAKDLKGTLKKLLKYISSYKISIFFVLFFAIGSTIFMILGPDILGEATTVLYEGLIAMVTGTGGIDFSKIGKILIWLLCIYMISAMLSYLQGFLMTGVSNKVTYRLRKDISKKMNLLPLSYYDKTTNGEVLSRITNDVDTISSNLHTIITQIITSVVTVIGILYMMIRINIPMTIISLFVFPVAIVFIMLVVGKSQKYFMKQQEYLGHINGHIEEMYGSHTLVKAFNGEEKANQKFEELNQTLYDTAWKSQFLSGMMHPIMNFIGNLNYVIVCILGGYYASQGKMTVGNIQAFIQYVRQFNNPIAQLANISNVLQQTMAATERVFEFLNSEEEIKDKKHTASIKNIQGEITFEHVKFGYRDDHVIIKDFNAKVSPGQTIAIVGPTGAGKTTIVKLLMRFYELNSGSIKIDGIESTEFSRNDLRSLFGMVLQDTWLYSGTVKDNIRYGRLDATDEEVEEACKTAQIDHFIRTLSSGYDTMISDDAASISLGEKQLLTIARAILADPKILILDEATSSVDTRTEILIQQAMDKLMEGRTSFIIAHRLSTIKNADLILVMKEGDIVEQGTHEELLKKDGFYATLYNSQFEEAEI